jgi:hypothetical protein
MDPHDWNKKVGQITAKAWADDAFKKRLLSDPTNVLKECGLAIPPGITIKMTEDTETLVHFSLPSRPNEAELSEEDLAAVAGGLIVVDESLVKGPIPTKLCRFSTAF